MTPEQEVFKPIVRYAVTVLFALFCVASVSILIVTARWVFWSCP